MDDEGLGLTVQTVFLPIPLDLVQGQAVLGVDAEVVAALLPRLHVAVLHDEGSKAPLEREKVLPKSRLSSLC